MPPNNLMPPVHPGEILSEELEAMDLSPEELDESLSVPRGTVAAIVEKKRGIDAEFALRLSRYLGAGERLWMNLQASYDLKIAEQISGDLIKRQVQPRSDLPEYLAGWDVE
jgi:addiction module HigA family antidote